MHVEERASVRHITFQRPPANALSLPEYTALRAAFTVRTDARVCVLKAVGTTFCAGQDLDEAAALKHTQIADHLRTAGSAVAAAARSPLPLVAVVSGPAVGTGALLVALADVVVMRDDAWLRFPEARYGMPIGLSLLSRFVPDRLARQWLATATRISATQLAALGAADHVVGAERLDEVADQVVQALLDLPQQMCDWLFATQARQERAEAYLSEVEAAAALEAWHF